MGMWRALLRSGTRYGITEAALPMHARTLLVGCAAGSASSTPRRPIARRSIEMHPMVGATLLDIGLLTKLVRTKHNPKPYHLAEVGKPAAALHHAPGARTLP